MGDAQQYPHRLNILISEEQYCQLSEAAEKYRVSRAAFIRRAVERELERREEEELARAAADLAELYETDEELTALTALDGEDFK